MFILSLSILFTISKKTDLKSIEASHLKFEGAVEVYECGHPRQNTGWLSRVGTNNNLLDLHCLSGFTLCV